MIMCIAVPFSQDKIHLALFSHFIEQFSKSIQVERKTGRENSLFEEAV